MRLFSGPPLRCHGDCRFTHSIRHARRAPRALPPALEMRACTLMFLRCRRAPASRPRYLNLRGQGFRFDFWGQERQPNNLTISAGGTARANPFVPSSVSWLKPTVASCRRRTVWRLSSGIEKALVARRPFDADPSARSDRGKSSQTIAADPAPCRTAPARGRRNEGRLRQQRLPIAPISSRSLPSAP